MSGTDDLGWWTIGGAGLMRMLRRVQSGESPDWVYAEEYANSDHVQVQAENDAAVVEANDELLNANTAALARIAELEAELAAHQTTGDYEMGYLHGEASAALGAMPRDALANSMSRHAGISDWYEKADLVIADLARQRGESEDEVER